ncbi:hypothetical protein P8452_27338 [Trifolium repens]|nr:hypothetical protein P8452_27338 [Trifolium repens]
MQLLSVHNPSRVSNSNFKLPSKLLFWPLFAHKISLSLFFQLHSTFISPSSVSLLHLRLDSLPSQSSGSLIGAYEKGLMIAFIPFTSKALEPCQWEYTIKMLMDYYHKPLFCS